MTGRTQLTRHGGRILADALAGHGVRTAFGVPGESFLPVLDGLHDVRDRLKFVICRQEGGASYMAEAWAKLTGEPGVLFVTRGPGATNGSVGVHTAFQDSTPMVVFVGQVGNDFVEREAFQEIDYRRMYGPLTKWVAQIDRAERIPEYVSHAVHTATAGRPGPVLLALPEDMLFSEAAVADAPRFRAPRPRPPTWRNSGACSRLPGVHSCWSAAGAGPTGRLKGCAAGARRPGCPWDAPSAARIISTTGIRITRATSASASIRSSRSA